MSPNSDEPPRTGISWLVAFASFRRGHRGPALFAAACIVLGFAVTLLLGPGASVSGAALTLVDRGSVAERDIVADRKVSYVDDRATRLRVEAEERLVLPIFIADERAGLLALDRFGAFQQLLLGLVEAKIAPDTLYLRVQSEFPGLFTKPDVIELARFAFREQAFADSEAILRRLLDRGILSIPSTGLERFNGDYVELRRSRAGRVETDELPLAKAVTLPGLSRAVAEESAARRLVRPGSSFVALLVGRFAVENAFFDSEASLRRLDAARKEVEPVIRTVAPGERLVRKGLVVSEADYAKLLAVSQALSKPDWGKLAGDGALFIVLALLAILLLKPQVSGATLGSGEVVLAAGGLLLTYVLAVVAIRHFSLPLPMQVGLLLPSALLCLVLAVFAGQRFAYLFAFLLALLVLLASDYDARAFSFALLSSVAATFVVRRAESRMDLVKAGLRLGLLTAAAAAMVALPVVADLRSLGTFVAWGALNGFASALLALGLFPVLEQVLNAPTRFRLIELSDLNAPIMKRLLAAAPGTYSHSIAVAHLAEAACRDIGADPLLARVGAYYHDIGKVDQPEYFVENQTGYNKHDDINPRLSVTVIRSHVKLGAEKARALGLPGAVVDIVAQHHGNGLITWFYDRASREDEVDPEDFSYPGQPPASREAAVVMLADAAEAASRSLKKPTPARLDGLLKDIFLDRVRQGQLERCDLTFRDLEIVRSSFTKILSGHFHARIEYPRAREAGK